MILIKNGSLLTEDGFAQLDLLVDGHSISAIAKSIDEPSAEVLDASGCLVGPGFVDVHVHFREPGHIWKEDIESGSASAAAGGFTAVVAMPNTEPAIDSPEVVDLVATRGREVGLVEMGVSGALTVNRKGVVATDVETLYEAGVRIFSDDGDSVLDEKLLEGILMRLSRLEGAVVAQHAEDHERTSEGHMHAGQAAEILGIEGLASATETDIVRRDIDLVRRTRARYHCQHVSAKETADVIRAAKAEGLPVTAEVAPHHLSFTDDDVASLGTALKMYPPVRGRTDREALREALRDGTIDMVATDHAPHTHDEKQAAFESAPRGVIGLETAASVANELVSDHVRFFEVMSINPATLAGMEHQGNTPNVGGEANLVVFDPTVSWKVDGFVSKAQNSPYRGAVLKGRVLATIYRGTITHKGVMAGE